MSLLIPTASALRAVDCRDGVDPCLPAAAAVGGSNPLTLPVPVLSLGRSSLWEPIMAATNDGTTLGNRFRTDNPLYRKLAEAIDVNLAMVTHVPDLAGAVPSFAAAMVQEGQGLLLPSRSENSSVTAPTSAQATLLTANVASITTPADEVPVTLTSDPNNGTPYCQLTALPSTGNEVPLFVSHGFTPSAMLSESSLDLSMFSLSSPSAEASMPMKGGDLLSLDLSGFGLESSTAAASPTGDISFNFGCVGRCRCCCSSEVPPPPFPSIFCMPEHVRI